jgi:hypothetical protein
MKIFRFIFLLVLFPVLSSAETLFNDSFESGDLSTTSADGFSWGNGYATSIVTNNPQCGGLNAGDPTAIYNGASICNGPIAGKDWAALDGNNSLRFRFASGREMSEQRFSLGKHYPDIWIKYNIRVPINFAQGSLNNKFLALWVDNYDSLGDVTWQTRPAGGGSANLVFQDGGVAHGEEDPTAFITVPKDRGRWMEVIVHVKTATTSTSNDGVIQLWRKWYDDQYYTKIHEKLNARVNESGAPVQGISAGYVFGWANDPYDAETEWLLDNWSIYDTLETPETSKAPKKIADFRVE